MEFDFPAIAQFIGTIGVGAAGMFGLMYLERLKLANQQIQLDKDKAIELKDAEADLEDSKINFKRAENDGLFIRTFGELTHAIRENTESSKANVDAARATAQAMLGIAPSIQAVESNVNNHMDNLINPYQEIHHQHATKLDSLIETSKVLVQSLNGLKNQNIQQLEALNAISETVKMLADDTAELNTVSLINDNHKDNIQ